MRLKFKSSIIAAVSALSLAAAARRNSKPRDDQENSSEPRTHELALDVLDLNEASKEELMELDGLEASVAERIIRMRPYHDQKDASEKLGRAFPLQPAAAAKAA